MNSNYEVSPLSVINCRYITTKEGTSAEEDCLISSIIFYVFCNLYMKKPWVK